LSIEPRDIFSQVLRLLLYMLPSCIDYYCTCSCGSSTLFSIYEFWCVSLSFSYVIHPFLRCALCLVCLMKCLHANSLLLFCFHLFF
jgi:hypothetical protein